MAYLKLYMVVILIISNINGVSARCVGEQCEVTAVREGDRMTQCAALRKNRKLNCKWLTNYLYTPQSGVQLDRPSDFPPVRFEFNNNGWVESVKAAIIPLVSMPTRSYTPVIFNGYDPHKHGNIYQRGHIIGLSLGGPNRAINIVSQMAGWQGNGPWNDMEVAVRGFAIDKYGFAYRPVKTGQKVGKKYIYELKTTATKTTATKTTATNEINYKGLKADGEPQPYRTPHSFVFMKVEILYEHRWWDQRADGVKVPSKFIVSWWDEEEKWQWSADQIYVESPVFIPHQLELPRTENNRHRTSPEGGYSENDPSMKHVKIQDSFVLDSEYMMENIKFLFWCMLAAIGFCFTSFTAILMICVYKRIMKGDSDERTGKICVAV
eukprot:298222_1